MSKQSIQLNIPNLISLARLLCVPLTVWLILNDNLFHAFWVFVIAGLSDAVDGFIAKRFNLQTELGAYLDPLADKALLVSVFVTLGQAGYLESWLVIIVVFRDVLILGGAFLYHVLHQNLTMQPLLISKINTTAQFALAALVLGLNGYGIVDSMIVQTMVIVVAATSVLSGAAYVSIWGMKSARMEPGE